VKFNDSTKFVGPDKSNNVITDGKTCDFFTKFYKTEARYIDADNIYYNYRKYSQDNKDLSSSKLIDILSLVTCGYGVRLSYTIACIISILGAFSFLYWVSSRFYQLSGCVRKLLINFKKGTYHIFKKYIEKFFCFQFSMTQTHDRLSVAAENNSTLSVLESMLLSIRGFTTLGSADWYTREILRY
jgi:hypothetical protein